MLPFSCLVLHRFSGAAQEQPDTRSTADLTEQTPRNAFSLNRITQRRRLDELPITGARRTVSPRSRRARRFLERASRPSAGTIAAPPRGGLHYLVTKQRTAMQPQPPGAPKNITTGVKRRRHAPESWYRLRVSRSRSPIVRQMGTHHRGLSGLDTASSIRSVTQGNIGWYNFR
jgi:hypothetical protein